MRRLVQQFVGVLIGTCLGAVVLHTFAAMGVISPVYVSAGSMAPHLLGPHWKLNCPACGNSYAVGTDAPPQAGRTECPQCGEVVLIGARHRAQGDRLLVDRATFSFRSPRRWETVVFRCPHDARTLCVKRILGLPGETIQFDRGDLIVDGNLQRKSLAEQRAARVLVHRERAAARRWMPRRQETHWTCEGDAWRISGAAARDQSAPGDWLDFLPPGGAAVTDRLAYNAGVPAVENATGDLMLTFRVAAHGSGSLWIDCGTTAAKSGDEARMIVRVSPRQRTAWISPATDRNREALRPPLSRPRESVEVAISLFDRQVLVTIDGGEVFRRLLPEPIEPATRPLAITAVGLGVELRDLTVWRDLVHTDQPGGSIHPKDERPGWRLNRDEYFVVGDNPAISDDSRTWRHGPGLRGRLIVGRPL